MQRRHAAIASAACLFLSACAQPAPPPPLGLLDITARPAEQALLQGLRAYDDAQYETAQRHFRQALARGLVSPADRAEAHKRLAFIDCAAGRVVECEIEFRLARRADGHFVLSPSEAGHPVWGPVYRKVLAN